MALIDSNKANLTNVSFLSETEKSFPDSPTMNPSLMEENLWLPARKTEGGGQARCSRDFDFCLSHSIPVFLNPVELSGRQSEGGVLALIKSEFPALGREAAGLLSHHPETLPSRRGEPCQLDPASLPYE